MTLAAAVESRLFGRSLEGEDVNLFTLRGEHGFTVELIDYGAIIRAIHVPGRGGELANIVLGYDQLAEYEDDPWYLGAVAGRCAGRIGEAAFSLDGRRFELSRNDGANHLHGGVRGFGKVMWRATPTDHGVAFAYRSPDGEEGYPGTVDVTVTYSVSEPSALVVQYEATTDRPTPVNLTQHAYVNLQGESAGTILDHELLVLADWYAPLGPELITTGELAPVRHTPFDFRTPRRIGEVIGGDDPQLRLAGGYDHSLAVRGWDGGLVSAAVLADPQSGRTMEVRTTEPAVHLYTGNFLDGTRTGRRGQRYARHAGLCLETQHFADSPNKPRFPSTILRPGEVLRSRTEFRFGTRSRP